MRCEPSGPGAELLQRHTNADAHAFDGGGQRADLVAAVDLLNLDVQLPAADFVGDQSQVADRLGQALRQQIGDVRHDHQCNGQQDHGIAVGFAQRAECFIVVLLRHQGPTLLGLLRMGDDLAPVFIEDDHARRIIGAPQKGRVLAEVGHGGGVFLLLMRHHFAVLVQQEGVTGGADAGLGDGLRDIGERRAHGNDAGQVPVGAVDRRRQDQRRLASGLADHHLLAERRAIHHLLEVDAIAVVDRLLAIAAPDVHAVRPDGEDQVTPGVLVQHRPQHRVVDPGVHRRHFRQRAVLEQRLVVGAHPVVDDRRQLVGDTAKPLLDVLGEVFFRGLVVDVPDRHQRDHGHEQHRGQDLVENTESEFSGTKHSLALPVLRSTGSCAARPIVRPCQTVRRRCRASHPRGMTHRTGGRRPRNHSTRGEIAGEIHPGLTTHH